MAKQTPGDDELLIRLDTEGLARLLKAVEAAMIDGRGHLTLGASGMTVSSGSCRLFSRVTVAFTDRPDPSDGDWRTRRPDPEPRPRTPVLEMQG